MFSNRLVRRRLQSAAALVGVALVIAGWLWLARGDGVHVFLAAACVAGLAIAAIVAWDFRQRAWQRWQDAVDAYARLQIERSAPEQPLAASRSLHRGSRLTLRREREAASDRRVAATSHSAAGATGQ
jgi:hypothetical protein